MLRLNYQALRARAEPIRMLLRYGGIAYEDRIFSMKEWPTVKKDKKIAPFGQLPSLELPNGETIAETGAIVRLVAKLANVYPTDVYEAARADMLFELVMDLNTINPILNWFPADSEKWKTAYDSYFGSLPYHLENLKEILGEKQFFGGNRPHHGDFGIFHILLNSRAVKPDVLNNYPNLQQYIERMQQLPAINDYLATRPGDSEVGMDGSFVRTRLPTKK